MTQLNERDDLLRSATSFSAVEWRQALAWSNGVTLEAAQVLVDQMRTALESGRVDGVAIMSPKMLFELGRVSPETEDRVRKLMATMADVTRQRLLVGDARLGAYLDETKET